MRKILLLSLFSVLALGCKSENKKANVIQPEAKITNSLKKLTSEETLEWVKNNVDSVLSKKTFDASNGLKMPYRIFSPSEVKEKIPVVIFLHGRGDRGTDNGIQTYKSTGLFMNEMSLLSPNMQAKYPCHILIPQCSDKTENEEWAKWVGNTPETPFKGLGEDGSYTMNETPSESGAAVLELIDKMITNLNIDPDRVYLIGKSMGGFGTWEFTARRPNLFAAAVPMAGYSDPSQVQNIKHIPYWIFHGDIDEYNPVEGSRTMFKLLAEAKADVKYIEYPGVNHGDSFKKAFNDPELIPWMFSKTKKRMKKYRNNGAVGALLDEYEKAIKELKEVVKDVTNEELVAIADSETKDPNSKSIQTALTHVIGAGYYYASATRRHLGDNDIQNETKPINSIEEFMTEVDIMFDYNEKLFKDYPDLKLAENDNEKKIHAAWGQFYDVEQLYEHAIVHILRHRRQIERFLIKLRK